MLTSPNSLLLMLARQAVLTTWITDTEVITQPFVTVEADAALRLAVDQAPPWRMTLPRHRHTDDVTSAAFSPDGKTIVAASSNKTARLWPSIEDLLKLAGSLVQREPPIFTPGERRRFGLE